MICRSNMTQEERWLKQFEAVKSFVENNKRRPSKYVPEERNMWNWLRHTQKLYNARELKADRLEKFEELWHYVRNTIM